VDNFEFLETDIHTLNQLNALSLVQGITSLFIGDEGNPIFHKNWRAYAIYRLEHWGLQYINNSEISDDDILEANRTYGSLGELAIMVMSPGQITALVRKFELVPKEMLGDAVIDLATVRDPNVKEIVAKEALHYKPKTMADQEAEAKNLQALENLLEVQYIPNRLN
jgi:leucine-rich repeat-containing protein 49